MQPGGIAPWKFGTPPGILPGKFLKYDSFFTLHCRNLSVSFERYSANCAQLFKCTVIVTKYAFLTAYFPKKLQLPGDFVPQVPTGALPPDPAGDNRAQTPDPFIVPPGKL